MSTAVYREESIFIPYRETDRLHLKRFCGNENGAVVFLLHGSIENGRIFYSRSGKGLAPFLAAEGFDVYVADLRGRGESTPPLGRKSAHGLTESIKEEIPFFLHEIKKIRGDVPMHWMAHSWGGILLLCYAARNPDKLPLSIVCFGTKRRIRISGWKKFWMVDVNYNYLFRFVTSLYGYVNVKLFRAGSDNETEKTYRQTYQWVVHDKWKDEDGFDYSKALKKIKLPPILFMVASHDEVLGHHSDVKLLMEELEQPDDEFYLAGKSNGNLHNYDHITLLTHPDAPKDHFPEVVKWMRDHST
ncbi:MAG: alpha/beta hydrolase [Chitinophagales bacterium]|nr:alpha/beta hydrolase [Chitinophagales bacterium]